jgi:signal peptidase I
MAGDDTLHDNLSSTWLKALFRPAQLFPTPAPTRRKPHPLSFAIAVVAVSAIVGNVLEGILAGRVARGVVAAIFGAVMSPFSVILGGGFMAALTHFWIRVGSHKGTFGDTFRAVCYAQAAMLFGVIPILGLPVAYIWYLVALCLILRHAQRVTVGRAVFAVLAGAASPIVLALVLRADVIEAFKIPAGSMMPSLMIGDHIFINKFTYGPFIPFTEMRPISRLPPERGDITVFRFPENKNQDFIKRTIALPGDTLEAINGRPVINGFLVPHCRVGTFQYEKRSAELYVEFLGDRSYLTLFDDNPDEQLCERPDACEGAGLACRDGICGTLQGPFKVAPGEVWVMGDNRNNSHDSRTWRGGLGAGVPFENIKGKGMFVWMSFGPQGEIVQERIFVSLHGTPVLTSNPELSGALQKCLQERSPVAQTTPPAGGRR